MQTRTLVDLLNAERGYVRIYADRDGFGYELSTYAPRAMADLFEQMSGYSSIGDACTAARYQLSSIHQTRSRRRKAVRKPATVIVSSSILPVSDSVTNK